MNTPDNFEKWNPAFCGAYRKGWEAGRDSLPETACPYGDKRNSSGKITWSRSFICAWMDGWRAGDGERRKAAIDEYYTDRNESGQSPLNAHR